MRSEHRHLISKKYQNVSLVELRQELNMHDNEIYTQYGDRPHVSYVGR